MRRVSGPVLIAALMLLLSVQVALAAKPIHEKFVVDETIAENLCGIEVMTHIEIKGNVLIFSNHVVDVSLIRITFTNSDGDWLENFIAGPVFIEEQLDGDILTVTSRNVGVHERLRSSEGLTAAFDRGQITFRDVIDLNDLDNPDDDVFVSSEILFQAGPHPEADSGFALFCEVVLEVLG